MEYKNLKSLKAKVSKIGLGCVTFGREIDKKQSLTILDRAFDNGINLLNTSYYYSNGESEKILGNFFQTRKNRKKFIIISKIHGDLSSSTIENCINDSLKRMQTDYIDFYGITYDQNSRLDSILETMEKFQKQGKILKVACNNYDYNLLTSAKKIQKDRGYSTFGMMETVYNILYRGVENQLIDYSNKEEIDIITYSPLGAGFITGKYKNGMASPNKTRFDIKPAHKDIYFKEKFFETMNKMNSLSKETNISLVDLALSWVISRKFITSVLIGVREISHIDRPIYLLENKIDKVILNKIDAITRNNLNLINP